MRKIIGLLLGILALSIPAMAQDAPKVEIFGGYSYLRATSGDLGINLQGWNASVAVNANSWFGIEANFSGNYGSPISDSVLLSNTKVHTFLFGPRIVHRGERVQPHAHVLIGGAHARSDVAGFFDVGQSALAFALGGGADIKVNNRLAIRLAQLDWIRTRFAGETQDNWRFSTGIVIRLGGK